MHQASLLRNASKPPLTALRGRERGACNARAPENQCQPMPVNQSNRQAAAASRGCAAGAACHACDTQTPLLFERGPHKRLVYTFSCTSTRWALPAYRCCCPRPPLYIRLVRLPLGPCDACLLPPRWCLQPRPGHLAIHTPIKCWHGSSSTANMTNQPPYFLSCPPMCPCTTQGRTHTTHTKRRKGGRCSTSTAEPGAAHAYQQPHQQ